MKYRTLRRCGGGVLAVVGITAMSLGAARLSGSGAVSLTLLILGLASVVFGVKVQGRRSPGSRS